MHMGAIQTFCNHKIHTCICERYKHSVTTRVHFMICAYAHDYATTRMTHMTTLDHACLCGGPPIAKKRLILWSWELGRGAGMRSWGQEVGRRTDMRRRRPSTEISFLTTQYPYDYA